MSMIILTPAEINLIKEESILAEKQGKLTTKQLQLIYKKAWFHLLVPENIGEKELSLPDFARFMEELASVDGSFAWAINLGAGANMFAGYMEQHTAKTIFIPKETCVAGSGAVGGTATKENNGYLINGHWKYASGAAHATFFSLNAEIKGEDVVKSFLVPAKEVKLLSTWNVSGLKATGSCEFKIENAWVPHAYCFDLQQASPWVDSPLYRFPFYTLAEINMLVMLTGLAIQFQKLGLEIVKEKAVFDDKEGNKIYEDALFRRLSDEVDQVFCTKRRQTFELLDKLWLKTKAEKAISDLEKEEFTKAVIQTAIAARNMVDQLYPFLGMNVIFESSEIGRVYRDFKVASQHALLSPIRG